MEATATGSSVTSKEEFLRLFVTQLKNQSPMDPLKGHEFIAQLAQFSSLEQLTNLNTTFADNLKFQQLAGGSEFIGKKATYVDPAVGGTDEGVIQGAITHDGSISLVIQNREIPISDIIGIFENK